MKEMLKILVLVGLVMALAVTPTFGKDKATIKIGVPIPLSGGFGVYGEQMKMGAELALSEINGAGGILGRKVEIVYADTESEVQPTIDKVKGLLHQNKVDVLIGIISSASRDAVIPIVYRAKKVLIYPTTYEGGVYSKFKGKGSRYVFTTGPVSEQYIKPFIPWIMKNLGTSFYMIGMDYIYGHGSIANAKKYVNELGGKVVGEELIAFGTTDFGAVLNRILAAKPDVLFAVIAGDDLTFCAKQFHEFGLKEKGISFTTSELDESYMTAIGAEAVNGMACSYPYFMGIDTKENEQFLKSMKKKFGKDTLVSLAAESQYTAMRLFEKAANRAGSIDTEALIQGLEGVEVSAPEGNVWIRAADHQGIVNDTICVVKADKSLPPEQWMRIVERHKSIIPVLQ